MTTALPEYVGVCEMDELTINWHIREQCNFDCYFCYAKYGKDTSFRETFKVVLHELSRLPGQQIDVSPLPIVAKRIRLNFAGGEPFLERLLGEAIELAHDLDLSPSFISNGSLIDDAFIDRYGPMVSVAGFSLDSFSSETSKLIGRATRKGKQVTAADIGAIFARFRSVSPETILKINTVVCAENVNEDFSEGLALLQPDRWKILRVIPIHGARPISDEAFTRFVERHCHVPGVVVEDNKDMHRSYIMIDPKGRFYQREGSGYVTSRPIVNAGAKEALRGLEFDVSAYLERY